jgi:murein L,D-transpeptidase YafK
MRQFILILLLVNIPQLHAMSSHVPSNKYVDIAIAKYSEEKEPELVSMFNQANVKYPPKKIALLAFKKEQNIELWAKDKKSKWRCINTYPLTAFSGNLGPKLKEYDRQIPEGIYKLTMFNPFSTMHLSMLIDYPNNFDRKHANLDGRRKLGGDIFLHGKTYSVGCLAVGNDAIEQLFLLSRRVGLKNIQIIISPNDLRSRRAATNNLAQPSWLPELYKKIGHALSSFPLANKKTA